MRWLITLVRNRAIIGCDSGRYGRSVGVLLLEDNLVSGYPDGPTSEERDVFFFI